MSLVYFARLLSKIFYDKQIVVIVMCEGDSELALRIYDYTLVKVLVEIMIKLKNVLNIKFGTNLLVVECLF